MQSPGQALPQHSADRTRESNLTQGLLRRMTWRLCQLGPVYLLWPSLALADNTFVIGVGGGVVFKNKARPMGLGWAAQTSFIEFS